MTGILSDYTRLKRKLENLYWQKHPNWHLKFRKYEDEQFKKIDGYHGLYFISNYGQVISFQRRFPFVRKYKFMSGCFYVELCFFGSKKNYFIHDLVYSHFNGTIQSGKIVIHKNGISTDNFNKNLGLSKVLQRKYKRYKRYDFSLYHHIESESDNLAGQVVPVVQFDIQGDYVGEHESMKSASIETGIDGSLIRKCLRGAAKSAGGFQWKRKKEHIKYVAPHTIEPVRYKTNPRSREVLQFNLHGRFIKKYSSLSEATRSTGASQSNIYSCISGRYRISGGYQWRFGDDPLFSKGIVDIDPVKSYKPPSRKSVCQFDLQGNFIKEYSSIKEASRQLKIADQNIGHCLKGRIKSCGGFQWKYKLDIEKISEKRPLTIPPVSRLKENTKKPVLQFKLNGKYMKEYPSIGEAARKNGIHVTNIQICISGKTGQAGGYQWRLKGSIKKDTGVPRIEPLKGSRRVPGNFRISKDAAAGESGSSFQKRAVYQFNLEGQFIRQFDSITAAGKSLGISTSNLNNCLQGNTQTAGGFQWRYQDDPRFRNGVCSIEPRNKLKKYLRNQVLQFDLEGRFLQRFNTIMEASRSTKIHARNISRCVNGISRFAGVFQWRSAKDPEFINGVKDIEPVRSQRYPTSRRVLQFDLKGNLIGEYRSVNNAYMSTGVPRRSIYNCLSGMAEAARGFVWKFG